MVTYNDGDAHIGEREAESDFQWITNFIIQPGYYDGSPEADRKGYDRYERIYQELDGTEGVVKDEKAAMDIPGKRHSGGTDQKIWICLSGENRFDWVGIWKNTQSRFLCWKQSYNDRINPPSGPI